MQRTGSTSRLLSKLVMWTPQLLSDAVRALQPTSSSIIQRIPTARHGSLLWPPSSRNEGKSGYSVAARATPNQNRAVKDEYRTNRPSNRVQTQNREEQPRQQTLDQSSSSGEGTAATSILTSTPIATPSLEVNADSELLTFIPRAAGITDGNTSR